MMKRLQLTKFYQVSVFLLSIVFFVILLSAFDQALSSVEGHPLPTTKYYTSIIIEENDTLWDIAQEYISDDYSSIHDFIEEVKDINHLVSDKIIAGEYIIVPYYDYTMMVTQR